VDGVSPQALKNTTNEYSGFCDRMGDPVFAKTPSFCALHASILCNQSGVPRYRETNQDHHRMEVLDKHDEPIPGLYEAGSDTGGRDGDTYCLDLSGTTFAFAIRFADTFSGRTGHRGRVSARLKGR
jgi:fumarate reductase flavoprotein subunit